MDVTKQEEIDKVKNDNKNLEISINGKFNLKAKVLSTLNIKDKDELDKVEASLSYLRLRKLEENNFNFSFDIKYYLNLHQ